MINLPAMPIAGLVTWLLVTGTRASATVNAILVVIKVLALTVFLILAVPVMNLQTFEPFAPLGIGRIGAASPSSFFSSGGFTAVSSAAEEPQAPPPHTPPHPTR